MKSKMNLDNYIHMNKKTSDVLLAKTGNFIYNIKNDSIEFVLMKSGIYSDVFEFAKTIFKNIDYKIDMRILYSTDVYPEILMKDGNGSLLWDLCFWQLYEKYVKYMLFLEEIDTVDTRNNFREQYIGDLLFYLSNRLDEYTEIAYVLAEKFMLHNIEFPYFVKYKVYDGSKLDIYLNFSQKIVLLHERNHYLFKKKPEEYERWYQIVCSFIKLGYKYEDKETQFIYDKILTNKNANIIEEMLCDYKAVVETIIIHVQTRQSTIIVQKIYEAFLFYCMATSNLEIIERIWRNLIEVNMKTIDKEDVIFSEDERLLIRGKICEDLIIYFCDIYLKEEIDFRVKKYVDLDYEVFRQGIHYLYKKSFCNEIMNSAERYIKSGHPKSYFYKEKMEIFEEYWKM